MSGDVFLFPVPVRALLPHLECPSMMEARSATQPEQESKTDRIIISMLSVCGGGEILRQRWKLLLLHNPGSWKPYTKIITSLPPREMIMMFPSTDSHSDCSNNKIQLHKDWISRMDFKSASNIKDQLRFYPRVSGQMTSRSLARFSSLYLSVDHGTYTVTWPATKNKKPDPCTLAPRVLLGWVGCYSIYPGGRRTLHVISAASSLMHTFWHFRMTNLRASGSCLHGRCSWSTSTESVGVSVCLLCCTWQHPGIDHSQNPYQRRAKQCTVLLPARDPTEAHLCLSLIYFYWLSLPVNPRVSTVHMRFYRRPFVTTRGYYHVYPLSSVKPGLDNTARQGLDVNSDSWWPC